MIPASRGEGLTTESCYKPAGSGAADSRVTDSSVADSSVMGSSTAGSSIAGSGTEGSSDGAPLVPTTPIFQELASNPIPAGGATAK